MVLFARDIVEKDFISADSKTNAFEAAKIMRDRRRGFVIVTGGDGSPIGIVTEWDYISKVAAEGRDPSGVALEEIMSTNLVTVNDDWGIDQVSQFMAEKGIRRVLVLHKGTMIGVITSKTVLSALKNYLDTVSVQIARLQGPWR
jgi:CBS domain-containing protein